ncbi:MAG: hypothetical protein HYY13_07310 [Nitrospirae bacterium]|nr:hypothetical protein [Nitrospirota bacterium]
MRNGSRFLVLITASLAACEKDGGTPSLALDAHRPAVLIEGYKDLRWGMSPQEVLHVLSLPSFGRIYATGDRFVRWGEPTSPTVLCRLFCGRPLEQAFWIWYGSPTRQAEALEESVQPVTDAIPEREIKVFRVGGFDEYVTFLGDRLTGYWFPLSPGDWEEAGRLLEKTHGPPSAALTRFTLTPVYAGQKVGMPFKYDGAVWFGPVTTIYSVNETYRAERAASSLGYIFYLSSLFDTENFRLARDLARDHAEGKTGKKSRQDDFVRYIIE